MATKARFPLLLLLGIVFLASVSVSHGIAYWEHQNPSHEECVQSCKTEKDPYRHEACETRCKIYKDPKREEPEDEKHHQPREDEGEDQPRPQPRPRHKGERTRGKGSGSEEDERERRGRDPRDNPEEGQRDQKKQSEEDEDEERGSESERRNPFLFKSNKFQTVFKNQHGHIRLLQRFDQRSNKLENLREYRLVELLFEPNALFLPHHSDADFLLVVLSGKATLILLSPDKRESYNLEEGDAQRIPAGTTFYLLNPDDNQNLRVVTLAITVRRPGKVESFFVSSTQSQQSYLRGFSENFLEASFDAPIEEIEKVLLLEEKQEEGVIVKVSRDHIRELSKHAVSSSRKSLSSEDKPFNLRSGDPVYSNKFGKFFEITPEKNPQLQDLDIFLSCVEINEGGLMLPHYNSRATVILMINEGKANIELVGLRNNQQQQEEEQEEGNWEVQKYRAKLSGDDVFIIPLSHPVAVKASSDLRFVGIGINAENNQRNFLAGEKDNMMRHIHRPVKDLAFPGSGQDVEKLTKNQKQSYFADAQSQQREDEENGRRSPLSSILRAFY